MRSFNF